MPGRLNETWFKVDEPGTYYGQCSELCGNDHGFMPIMVQALSKADFDAWVGRGQEEVRARRTAPPATQRRCRAGELRTADIAKAEGKQG